MKKCKKCGTWFPGGGELCILCENEETVSKQFAYNGE